MPQFLQSLQVDFVENYKESLKRLKSIASETVHSLDLRGEETLHITGELALIIYSVCVFEPVSLFFQLQPIASFHNKLCKLSAKTVLKLPAGLCASNPKHR